jgi:ribose 5-phosphate isomerase A
VRCQIVLAHIRFGFHDPATKAQLASAMHQDRSDQIAGQIDGIAAIEGSGKFFHPHRFTLCRNPFVIRNRPAILNCMDPKQRAAEAALRHVQSDMIVGLGTGSTATFFIQALGEAVRSGKLRGIRGIPTSERSAQLAKTAGISVVDFTRGPRSNLCIDGADEVGPGLQLIKGLGGALLREKVVAQNSEQFIVIADASKVVSRLGTHNPLPVEVTPFGHEIQPAFFRTLGCDPVLRKKPDGTPFVTDNGNYIYDCRFKFIQDAVELQKELKSRAGIVETGLFLNIAKLAIIADATEVRERTS